MVPFVCLPFTDFRLLVWAVGRISLDRMQYVNRNQLNCYSHADTDPNTNHNSNLNRGLSQPCPPIPAFIYGRLSCMRLVQ